MTKEVTGAEALKKRIHELHGIQITSLLISLAFQLFFSFAPKEMKSEFPLVHRMFLVAVWFFFYIILERRIQKMRRELTESLIVDEHPVSHQA
jgi:hypothetical protein